MKYYYVTFYYWKDDENGMGSCFLRVEHKLNKRYEIKKLRNSIMKEANFDEIIIQNWKRIRKF